MNYFSEHLQHATLCTHNSSQDKHAWWTIEKRHIFHLDKITLVAVETICQEFINLPWSLKFNFEQHSWTCLVAQLFLRKTKIWVMCTWRLFEIFCL